MRFRASSKDVKNPRIPGSDLSAVNSWTADFARPEAVRSIEPRSGWSSELGEVLSAPGSYRFEVPLLGVGPTPSLVLQIFRASADIPGESAVAPTGGAQNFTGHARAGMRQVADLVQFRSKSLRTGRRRSGVGSALSYCYDAVVDLPPRIGARPPTFSFT